MIILRILLRVLGYGIYGYALMISLYFILGWFGGARNSKFYYALERIAYPFNRVFGGKLIIGGVLDIGSTLGLFMIVVIAQFFISLSYGF
ncbi:MAG: hypothetical protein K6G38_02310 [Gammaproteobacteria bacterium]|nr:hypothetical protein [Gammaproteobacteria bacterium]